MYVLLYENINLILKIANTIATVYDNKINKCSIYECLFAINNDIVNNGLKYTSHTSLKAYINEE